MMLQQIHSQYKEVEMSDFNVSGKLKEQNINIVDGGSQSVGDVISNIKDSQGSKFLSHLVIRIMV